MAYEPYGPIETDTPGVTAPVTPVYAVRPTLSTFSIMVQFIASLNLRHSLCESCGSIKPKGQSCGCFDNGGQ